VGAGTARISWAKSVQSHRPSAMPTGMPTTIPASAAIDACQAIVDASCRCVNPSVFSRAGAQEAEDPAHDEVAEREGHGMADDARRCRRVPAQRADR
jgi:hypothetical protein